MDPLSGPHSVFNVIGSKAIGRIAQGGQVQLWDCLESLGYILGMCFLKYFEFEKKRRRGGGERELFSSGKQGEFDLGK